MEAMYISNNGVVTIGDTLTGNHRSGVRYFGYNQREAEQRYRHEHGLRGVHFHKVKTDHLHFGFMYS